MSNSAIKVENIGKRYRIGAKEEKAETLAQAIAGVVKSPLRSFRNLRSLSSFDSDDANNVIWALRDVSFEVKHGEVIGLIGRNGAGKSTLLKILSRITQPTDGHIDLYGRVASLLEVGTGFHPELTGRENVYLNGTILGMRKAEIDRKFDEIVAFSGVETFIDTPVKRYSSGMKVRLAFSVAAHLEPEILLVDEVLAVGDTEFQRKCLGKMESVAGEGRTVLFVSHQMSMIQALCQRGILLKAGEIVLDSEIDSAIQGYLHEVNTLAQLELSLRTDREGDGSARAESIWLEDFAGTATNHCLSGQAVRICIGYKLEDALSAYEVSLGIYDSLGRALAHNSTRFDPRWAAGIRTPHKGVARCEIARLPLPPGEYYINTSITRNGHRADRVERAGHFYVEAADYYGVGKLPEGKAGSVLLDYSWDVQNEESYSNLEQV